MITKHEIDEMVKSFMSKEFPDFSFSHILYYFERPYIDHCGDVVDDNSSEIIYHLPEVDAIIVPYTFITDFKNESNQFYFVQTLSTVNSEPLEFDYIEAVPVEPFEEEKYVLNKIPLDKNIIIGERLYRSVRNTTETVKYSTFGLPVLIDIQRTYNSLEKFESLLEEEAMKLMTYENFDFENLGGYDMDMDKVLTGKEAYNLLKRIHKAGLHITYRSKYYPNEKEKIYEVNGSIYVVGAKNAKEVKKLKEISVESILMRENLEELKNKKLYNTVANVHDITDIKANDKLAILLLRREWLPYLNNVGSNEYQFMYSALTFEYAGGRLIVSIPIHIFSFPQEISGAHIDYKLKDISDQREKLYQYEQEKLQEAVSAYEDFAKIGAEKIKLTGLHSMHRHPGRFSFSSTDRSKNVDDVGVIYRNLYAENAIQHDSVIVVENGVVDIHTTETYIVNVKPENEKELEKAEGRNIKVKGTYTEIPTITFIVEPEEKESSPLEKILGEFIDQSKRLLSGISYVGDENYALRETPIHIATMFKDIEFTPGIHVDPNHYKDRVYRLDSSHNYYKHYNFNII